MAIAFVNPQVLGLTAEAARSSLPAVLVIVIETKQGPEHEHDGEHEHDRGPGRRPAFARRLRRDKSAWLTIEAPETAGNAGSRDLPLKVDRRLLFSYANLDHRALDT